MLLDVVVGVDAPHLVRPADEVDAELRQDVGRVVQRLGEVVDSAPDEHPQRARIVAPRGADDPVRSFRRASNAGARRGSSAPCFVMRAARREAGSGRSRSSGSDSRPRSGRSPEGCARGGPDRTGMRSAPPRRTCRRTRGSAPSTESRLGRCRRCRWRRSRGGAARPGRSRSAPDARVRQPPAGRATRAGSVGRTSLKTLFCASGYADHGL